MRKELIIALGMTAVSLRAYGQCTPPTQCAGWTGNETITTTPASVGVGTTAPKLKLDIATVTSDGIAIGQQPDNTQTIQTYIDGHWSDRATYANGCCNALLLEPDAGVVGIGTSSPNAKLHVASPAVGSAALRLQGPNGDDWFPFYDGKNYIRGTTIIADTGGNVGVGTANPAQRLSVAGTVESTTGGFKFPDGSMQTSAFAPSAGGVLSVSSGLGVGTAAPLSNLGFGGASSAMLDLKGASSTYILHSTGSAQESAFSTSGTGVYIDIGGHATAANNFIAFRTTNTANSFARAEAMRITSSGSVEIGVPVSDPSVRLNVNGNATINGTLTATSVVNAVFGQDVAEWVRADRDLPAGTVVILNPAMIDEVIPSTSAYDTTVAGVVSARPGIILGRAGALKATVATSGRVRVRVDARNSSIHVGDLLVTSDEPGTAMKSQPIDVGGRKFHQPGTILGKALEPLPDGVGEILVLLCLG